MKIFRLLLTFLATACSASSLVAAPGDLDPSFTLNLSGTPFATAVLPEGKILVGGSFSGGSQLARLMRGISLRDESRLIGDIGGHSGPFIPESPPLRSRGFSPKPNLFP